MYITGSARRIGVGGGKGRRNHLSLFPINVSAHPRSQIRTAGKVIGKWTDTEIKRPNEVHICMFEGNNRHGFRIYELRLLEYP
jgi:hypothetical protein